ncbi:MAG: DUF1549 domain-containing protein [Gemmataceae bacterium]
MPRTASFPCIMLGVLFIVSALAAETPPKAAKLSVEPAQVILSHAGARQQLLVSGELADGSIRDLTRAVRYVSSDPAIAAVDARGIVTPKGNGETTLQVIGDMTVTVAVTVQSVEPRPVSFTNDIMPILAKASCNSGACHGAASGKQGFKISLLGYDPAGDYRTLTRGTDGRRLNFIDPAQSLLILKPTGQALHEGGKRFDKDSDYAQLFERWIREGGTVDVATAPKLIGLEVFPAFRSFAAPNQEQQLLALARYSDGSVRDVTRDARYSSNNDLSARVNETGLVELSYKGEAAIMVRYGAFVAVSNLVVLQHDPRFAWTNPPENNYIDRLINAKLKSMEILPSELCSDAEFLRRVYYDVIGLPPTPAEIRAFLNDTSPTKRAKVIDALLERPEHAEFWASKWADLLRIRFDLMRDKGTWGLYRWLRDSIAANQPFDQFAREIITADGSCAENPPANFYRVFGNADDASEATVQVFLGIRLMCAKCHDHPFEKWVQNDYYGMSAFFSQVGRKAGSRRDDQVIFCNQNVAQARHPGTGALLTPKYLDAESITVTGDQDARAVLADWMTRKDNPFFARATVNRLWSHLFGRGIIDPVDDIRSSNPPVNAPLLDALAKDFVDQDYDVRHLLRTMLNSRTYQLSTRTNPSNAEDLTNFSHALPRRLSAEQLFDTVSHATGIRENFRARYGSQGSVALPAGGVRAGQLPDRAMTAEMLELFGRPRGESTCACERTDEASMTQALHLINGKSLATRIAANNGRAAQLARAQLTDEQLIEEVYLSVLCRLPRSQEMELMRQHFAANSDRAQATQDLMWVLLNTRELLYIH